MYADNLKWVRKEPPIFNSILTLSNLANAYLTYRKLISTAITRNADLEKLLSDIALKKIPD